MTENKEPKKISGTLKKFFGVGDFGFSLMSNIDTYYASYFFTNIAKFSTGIVAVMTTISAVVECSPFYAVRRVYEQREAAEMGTLSFLADTDTLACTVFILQGSSSALETALRQSVFVTLAMITSRIAWNLPYVASISMINVAAKTSEDRMAFLLPEVYGLRQLPCCIPLWGRQWFPFFASVFGESNAYAATAFAFSCLMFAGMYAHFVMFKGYEPTGAEEEAAMAAVQKKASTADQPEVKAL